MARPGVLSCCLRLLAALLLLANLTGSAQPRPWQPDSGPVLTLAAAPAAAALRAAVKLPLGGRGAGGGPAGGAAPLPARVTPDAAAPLLHAGRPQFDAGTRLASLVARGRPPARAPPH